MSALEVVAFGVLWTVAVVLLCLVLVVYRQVEKAYGEGHNAGVAGLRPGVEAPPIELMMLDSTVSLQFPAEVHLLCFVATGCEKCTELVESLRSSPQGLKISLLQGQGSRPPYADQLPATMQWFGLGNPPETYRQYEVRHFPLLFVLHGNRVLAVDAVSRPDEVRELVQLAEENKVLLDATAAGSNVSKV